MPTSACCMNSIKLPDYQCNIGGIHCASIYDYWSSHLLVIVLIYYVNALYNLCTHCDSSSLTLSPLMSEQNLISDTKFLPFPYAELPMILISSLLSIIHLRGNDDLTLVCFLWCSPDRITFCRLFGSQSWFMGEGSLLANGSEGTHPYCHSF